MDRNEAIKVIKSNLSESRHQLNEALKTLIPEFQESEDERIRKWLISQLEEMSGSNDIDRENMILKTMTWLEKQGKQNSAWSEEDEMMLENAISSINHESVMKGLKSRGISYSIDSSTHLMENLIDWLKSLKDRVQPQPKQEWSKEDEKMLNFLIEVLLGTPSARFIPIKREIIITWLESLKERYTWKPTDEQMKALEKVRVILHNPHIWDESNPILYQYEELMRDLMKLREE